MKHNDDGQSSKMDAGLNSVVWAFLNIGIKIVISDGSTSNNFERKSLFDDVIKTADIDSLLVSGVLHCGSVCSRHAHCESFFYIGDTMACHLHKTILTNYASGELQTSPNTVYFAKRDDVFLECPQNDGIWTEARLPSGLSFMFKLFRNSKVTQTQAVESCISEGGNLLKILTEEKMDFVRNTLTQCTSVNGYGYWVDGSNNGASDHNATDAYKTVDNQTVPMTNDFWYPGMPDAPHSCPCIWVSNIYGYLFDDVTCLHGYADSGYKNGVYHICEKTVD